MTTCSIRFTNEGANLTPKSGVSSDALSVGFLKK